METEPNLTRYRLDCGEYNMKVIAEIGCRRREVSGVNCIRDGSVTFGRRGSGTLVVCADSQIPVWKEVISNVTTSIQVLRRGYVFNNRTFTLCRKGDLHRCPKTFARVYTDCAMGSDYACYVYSSNFGAKTVTLDPVKLRVKPVVRSIHVPPEPGWTCPLCLDYGPYNHRAVLECGHASCTDCLVDGACSECGATSDGFDRPDPSDIIERISPERPYITDSHTSGCHPKVQTMFLFSGRDPTPALATTTLFRTEPLNIYILYASIQERDRVKKAVQEFYGM